MSQRNGGLLRRVNGQGAGVKHQLILHWGGQRGFHLFQMACLCGAGIHANLQRSVLNLQYTAVTD